MASLQKPPPTWAQLTYTSADSVSGAKGGWGIKERSAITTDFIVAELLKGVSTRIVETTPTSNFPSDEELYTRPRRLLFRLVDDQPAMWHAATAGPDATGRPGNVFTHAAMLAAPEATMRPIEYWRSASWLTPFGAAPSRPPGWESCDPALVITRQSTIEFIDHGEREYAVEWLLAAVAWSIDKNQSMVLATDSPDEAAGWIGVISFLTAPALARRISWVTYDRADDVRTTVESGVTIICVPREDLSALLESRSADLLVLDPEWALDVPGDDKTWAAPGGQTFPTDPAWAGTFLDLIALQPAQRHAGLDRPRWHRCHPRAGRGSNTCRCTGHWQWRLLSDGESVVNNRGDVLLQCLAWASAASLTGVAGQRLVSELIAEEDTDELIAEQDDLPPVLAEAVLLAVADRYVDGGWRTGRHWPGLSPSNAQRLRAQSAPQMRKALDDAVEDAEGTDPQVLAAAKLLSFVLKFQLEPLARVPGEPGVLRVLHEKVRRRLADGFDIAPADRQDLDTSLLAIMSRIQTPVPLAAPLPTVGATPVGVDEQTGEPPAQVAHLGPGQP